MPNRIYSKDGKTLLHIINRVEEIESRKDIIPEDNFLQLATLQLNKGKTFKPHKHIWKERNRNIIAQESWIVIQGKVKCHFYDLDDTIISEPILEQGDASFTLEGAHTYTILKDNTLVYEYKTGPYEGQKMDKEFI